MLREMLENVEDSYDSFVGAIMQYANKKESRTKAIIEYMKANPGLKSSDIIEFVSVQPDFMEDAAHPQKEAI